MVKKSIVMILAASTLLVGCANKPPGGAPATPNRTAATPSQPATPAATPAATTTPTTSATSGPGEEVVLEEIGLKYVVPAGWKKASEQALLSPDEKLVIVFVTPPDGEAAEVLGQIAGNLGDKLKDVVVETQATEHEINGLSSFSMSGTGKSPEGKDMEWALELIKADKSIILLEMAEAGAFDTNSVTFEAFESSLERVEGAAAAPSESGTPVASETPAETGTPEATETPEEAETP